MKKAFLGIVVAAFLALLLGACQSSQLIAGSFPWADGDLQEQDKPDSDEAVTPDGDPSELDGKEDLPGENDGPEGEDACQAGSLRCAGADTYACVDGAWSKTGTCNCGCVAGQCQNVETLCTYRVVGCINSSTAQMVSDDGSTCCPDKTQDCAAGSHCDTARKGCVVDPNDGDIDTDGETSLLCDDNDLCTQDSMDSAGLCLFTPKTCGTCQVCEKTSGSCVCQAGCAKESCDNEDNNCNGQIDEGGACDNPTIGLRVEASWDNPQADLNLHVLRPGGVFGRPEEDDPDDCYWHYPKPTWGRTGHPGESPVFTNSSTAGGGENKYPETVHLAIPAAEPYRVLINYADSSSDYGSRSTNVWVKIYYDGQVIASYKQALSTTGQFWNVACIDAPNKKATAIANSGGSAQIGTFGQIDSNACEPPISACKKTCDCAQGYACISERCQLGSVDPAQASYCCDKVGCRAGNRCVGADGVQAFCGFTATFDSDTQGAALANKANVEATYLPWGLALSTSRNGAKVVTDAYVLPSLSANHSCGTLDNNNITRWKGPILMRFLLPGSSAPAQVTTASFYSGDTPAGTRNGLRVTAYNVKGAKVFEASIEATGKVMVSPEQPFSSLLVETDRDPDFVLDDISVPRLDIPPTSPKRR